MSVSAKVQSAIRSAVRWHVIALALVALATVIAASEGAFWLYAPLYLAGVGAGWQAGRIFSLVGFVGMIDDGDLVPSKSTPPQGGDNG